MEVVITAEIKVVMVEPGKAARVIEIGTELEDLQEAVGGGFIETFYPFEEEVCIVCNDEGKFNGMEPCRAIRDEDGDIADVIFGPFFLCDCSTDHFESLSDEQLQKYLKLFFFPEAFLRSNGRIRVIPYEPQEENL